MLHSILNRQEISIFLIQLVSKTSNSRISEAINILRKDYPYEITKDNLILIRNRKKGSYICIINKIDIDRTGVISTILYAKNHYKHYSGKVCFTLKNFNEVIQMDKGEIISSDVYGDYSKDIEQSFVKVNEDILYKNYNEKDLIKTIAPKEKIKKNLLIASICFGVICVLGVCFYSKIDSIRIQKEEQKKLETKKEQTEKLQSVNRKKLEEKRLEYLKLRNQQYEDVYNYICAIYNCIGNKSIIENLSIENNSFSVDVSTKDAITILENFESKNQLFNEIKMNRTVIEGNIEYVTYSGVFNKYIVKPDENLSVVEKIDFYETEIKNVKEKLAKMNNTSMSEYTRTIRSKLHSCNCQEQYIQYRANNQIAILECFIKSTSSSILEFLNMVKNSNENDIDIANISIRNSFDNDNIQTTIQFWTGIERKEGYEENLVVLETGNITPKEINSVFKKNSSKVSVPVKTGRAPVLQISSQRIVKTHSLKYIGKTKKQNETIIIFKDDEMNIIYKLPLLNSLANYDSCISDASGKYLLRIKDITYEVKE